MTELKTLNQIMDDSNDIEDFVYVRILREEAIKWVKALMVERAEWSYCNHHISWIKHFFNLTEEDLK